MDSPKKRMNEFGFFAVKSTKEKKQNKFVRSFLGESTARQSAYGLADLYFEKLDFFSCLIRLC